MYTFKVSIKPVRWKSIIEYIWKDGNRSIGKSIRISGYLKDIEPMLFVDQIPLGLEYSLPVEIEIKGWGEDRHASARNVGGDLKLEQEPFIEGPLIGSLYVSEETLVDLISVVRGTTLSMIVLTAVSKDIKATGRPNEKGQRTLNWEISVFFPELKIHYMSPVGLSYETEHELAGEAILGETP